MEFSPLVACSGALARWSPNGAMLAHAVNARVVIRDAASLRVLSSHCCLDAVDALFWAPNSDLLAASVLALGVTHVFCPSDETWTAKITEGPVGLHSSPRFSPDSRHVLSVAEFNVKMTIWSLSSKQVRYVKFAHCVDFSPGDGDRMAVAERNASDASSFSVALYDCRDWEEVARFDAGLPDVAGLLFDPRSGDRIVVWNGAMDFALKIFSASGRVLLDFSTGEDRELGVTAMSWSPCGQVLAAGGRGASLRIFNAVNCTFFTSFEHDDEISGRDPVTRDCVVYEEREVPAEDIDGKVIQEWLNTRDTVYESVSARPARLPVAADRDGKRARTGFADASFSSDGLFLASRRECMPCVAWIWDVQNVQLKSVLVHADPVCSMSWEPNHSRLALLTSGSSPSLFLWSSLGVVVLKIPVSGDLSPVQVRWNPQGRGAMCLVGRNGLVCSKIVRKKKAEEQKGEDEDV